MLVVDNNFLMHEKLVGTESKSKVKVLLMDAIFMYLFINRYLTALTAHKKKQAKSMPLRNDAFLHQRILRVSLI